MHKFEPFIDLRQNSKELATESSLWPTFTDIMTVVLMVFMFTMIAMIIKNSNLLQQLSVTEGQLELTEDQKESLVNQVIILEQQLKDKKMEAILLGDEKTALQKTIEAKLALISQLQQQLDLAGKTVTTLKQEIQVKEEALEKTKEALKKTEESYDIKIAALTEDTKKQIEEFNQKFAELMKALQLKEEKISTFTAEQQELELTLARQRQEYTVLEEKYNRLIRPSRSPIGREVVTVMYSKVGGKYRILLQDIGSNSFEQVQWNELHKKLGMLKDKYKNKLYVKIIFPENSNLSYNEAWDFTREILQKYDYYYQYNP